MPLTDDHSLVLITGISAAGKSTVADGLARRFARGVHVKGDVFRRMVVAGRHEMTASPSAEALRQLRLRYRLAAQTADAYYQAGFSVVVQDVVIGPLLAAYVESMRTRPLTVVVLAPRPDVVASREASRPKRAYRENAATIAEL
ncbi:MAG TPA: AAA family ATPase, partial [Acidimicrobiales bacterium]